MQEKHIFPVIALQIHKIVVLLHCKYQISDNNIEY